MRILKRGFNATLSLDRCYPLFRFWLYKKLVPFYNSHIGWCICDLGGKYSFSHDIIFNEDVHSSLKHSRVSQPSPLTLANIPPKPHPRHLLNLTEHHQLWTDAIYAHDAYLQQLCAACAGDNPAGGASAASGGDIPHPQPSLVAVNDFASLATLATVENHFDDMSSLKFSVISEHMSLAAHPNPLCLPKTFDLSKAPLNFHEARACPDIDVWQAAIQRELDTLHDCGIFQPTTLSASHKAIGTRWVYAYKLHPDGLIVCRKAKAHLIAQGFSQCPEDFGKTYAPIAKMTSIWVVPAFAAANNYEILCYNIKSAFLHALLSHQVYLKQIEGFPELEPSIVYLALQAIYSLHQSFHKFYCLFQKVLEDIGLIHCEVDHTPISHHLLIHLFLCQLWVKTW